MDTIKIICLSLIAAVLLVVLTLKSPKDLHNQLQEMYEEPMLASPGNTVVSASISLDTAAKRAADLMSFIPGAGGATYSLDKTIRMFPTPSQTWLLDYQTHVRKTVIQALDSLLMPPNTLCIFTASNFGGNVVLIPFGYLSSVGSTAIFKDSEQGHVLLFREILKLPKPVGGNTFSCIVPKNYKTEIGFENKAPPLKLPEGAHATISAPAAIIYLMITKVV